MHVLKQCSCFLRVLWPLSVCVISLYRRFASASVAGVLALSVLIRCVGSRPSGIVASAAGLALCVPSGVLAPVRVRRWSGLLPSWFAAVLVRVPPAVVPAVGTAVRVRCPASRPCPDSLRVSLRAFVYLPACAPARACAGSCPRGFGAGHPPSSNPSESRKKQKRLLRKYT